MRIKSPEGMPILHLEKLNPALKSWYKNDKVKSLNFASELEEIISTGGLAVVYEGKIDQDIVRDVFNSIERKLEEANESTKIKKRISHIIIELLQNISKYSHENTKAEEGAIIVGKNKEKYYIITRNEISRNQMIHITWMIDWANQELVGDGLDDAYQNKISNSKFTEQGGAGLGLIEIVRKSKQKMEYVVEPLENGNVVFYIKVTVFKENP